MLTKFSSLYAGHIDLGDMGQNETPPTIDTTPMNS